MQAIYFRIISVILFVFYSPYWANAYHSPHIKPISSEQDTINLFCKLYGVDEGLPQARITSLVQDKIGFVWIGTQNSLFRYDGLRFKQFNLPDNFINALYVDSLDLYVQTNSGTILKKSHNEQKFYQTKYQPQANITKSWEIKDNKLLIYDAQRQLTGEYDIKIDAKDKFTTITTDLHNNILMGTEMGKLIRFNRSSRCFEFFRYYDNTNKNIIISGITSILVDRIGNIWIGTTNHGLLKIPALQFYVTTFRNEKVNMPNQKISNNKIWSVFQDKNDIWIGTVESESGESGLNHIQTNNPLNLPKSKPVLSDKNIFAIVKDEEDNIWVGTNNGLNRVSKDGKIKVFLKEKNTESRFRASKIWELYIDRQKQLWIGTYAGLYYFDTTDNKVKLYDKNNKKAVWSIYEDTEYRLWIGSYGQGLYLANKSTQQLELYSPIADSSRIATIIEDKQKNIWIGTYGDGINQITDTKSKVIKLDNSLGIDLPSKNIHDILIDKRNNLFISTSAISKYTIETKEIVHYYFDEVGISEFNVGAAWSGDDGNLYFGSVKGLLSFNADSLEKFYKYIYTPAIANVQTINKNGTTDLDNQQLITLEHDQRTILIKFAPLLFNNDHKAHYICRLCAEGNEECQEFSIENSELPLALSHGNYSFEVSAYLGDKKQVSKSAKLEIKVIPTLTENTNFWLLIIVFIMLLFVGISIWIRKENKRRMELQKDANKGLVSQMHPHFFKNIIQVILGIKDHEEKNEILVELGRIYDKINVALKNDGITIEGELEMCARYVNLYQLAHNQQVSLEIQYDTENINPSWTIPPLLIQPLVENAVEHGIRHRNRTFEGQINLVIEYKYKQQVLQCTITDNGVGREASKKYEKYSKDSGVAIKNIEARLRNELQKKNYSLHYTDLAEGTKVEFIIPIRNHK